MSYCIKERLYERVERMEYKAFQYVLKIAELGNLTKAANELYVSQPSLSHYIARVEQEVGTPLFQRGVSPMRLTPAGEKYAETARMILALDKRMQQDIADIVDQKTGIIMLGMSHARASYLLPHLMPEFHRKYPGVDIRTTEARSDLLETYLAKGTCDLGVMPLPLSGKNDLESEVLFREELLLVSGKELPHETDESGREYTDLSVCQDAEFTLLKKGHGIRTALEAIFMEHGVRTGHVFETTSNETAYRLATVGMGLSIVPESSIILSAAVEKPYVYSISEKGLFWDIAAVYRSRDYLTEGQKYLVDLMKELRIPEMR